MKLPVMYADIPPHERWAVRRAYIEQQGGKCHHCGELLINKPRADILKKYVNENLFPPNFFSSPIHLHHSHDTGFTIGVVHNYCNAVLWQYHGK